MLAILRKFRCAGVGIMAIWAVGQGCRTLERNDMAAGMASPKVVSIHTVDASSPRSVVNEIIKPGMSAEEKAVAIWRYCWENTYHWPAPKEGPRETHELDVVYDAVKLLNVYGYSYCFAIRSLAEALYEEAGLEARSGGIGGHTIPEVYYHGKYHYLDNDQRGFSRLPDGTIASLDDYRGRVKSLILKPENPSRPFFPSTRSPRVAYEQKHTFAGYLVNQAAHFNQHDKYHTTHSMNFGLRPGERMIRTWTNAGKWHWTMENTKEYKDNGYANPWDGPRDMISDLYPESPRDENGKAMTFANGLLIYRPDLRQGAKDYTDGVYADQNIDSGGPGFRPAEQAKPAFADFRVRLPYVIVGWPGDVEAHNIRGAAVVSGTCCRKSASDSVEVLVSNSQGMNWITVWKAPDVGRQEFAVDISGLVEGRYEYLVRFKLAAQADPRDVAIESLGIDTAFQLNAKVLPAVRPGKNRMTVTFEDGAEVFDENIQYGKWGKPVHERLAREVKGLAVKEGSYATLGPPEPGGNGYVIYEMAAPPGGTIAWARVGGAFRSHFDPTAAEKFGIYYAVDQMKDWKRLWQADQAPYLNHWCFETNQKIELDHPVSRVFVKFELERSPNKEHEGGKMVGARLVWGCRRGRNGVPAGGIRVVHAWNEDGHESRWDRVVTANGEAYSFDVAAERVVNESISMEWADRPPAAKGPHALMLAPPVVNRRELADKRSVWAIREAIARLERNPSAATAADIMWNCPNEWERNAMPPTLIAIGGERARRELRKALGKVGGAENCLLELLAEEGPAAELAVFLGNGNAGTREKAACLLAFRGDPAVLDSIRAAIAKEASASALAAEVAALIRLGGLDAMQKASECEGRGGEREQIEVAAALAAKGMDRAFETLSRFADSPDKYTRCRAAWALAESGNAKAEPILIRLLEDSSRWPRQAATAGLARCGGPASIEPLQRMARNDREPDLRAEAEWAAEKTKQRCR